jgi:hypothetical protein
MRNEAKMANLHGNDPCSHGLRSQRITFMLEVRKVQVDKIRYFSLIHHTKPAETLSIFTHPYFNRIFCDLFIEIDAQLNVVHGELHWLRSSCGQFKRLLQDHPALRLESELVVPPGAAPESNAYQALALLLS